MSEFSFIFVLILVKSNILYAEICDKIKPIDLILLVDSTSSMSDDIDTLQFAIPSLMNSLNDKVSDNQFGLITFNWKPNSCMGNISTNYCARIESLLTSDTDVIIDGLSRMIVQGGSPTGIQDALGAILLGALNDNINWRITDDTVRVITILTDDKYTLPGIHSECSYRYYYRPYTPNNGDGVYECDTEDFPSVQQISQALKQKNIIPLFLVTDNQIDLYKSLLSELDVEGAVSILSSNSSNIIDLLISHVHELTCVTTIAPTTTEFSSTSSTEKVKPVSFVPLIASVVGVVAFLAVAGLLAKRYLSKKNPSFDANFTDGNIAIDDVEKELAATPIHADFA